MANGYGYVYDDKGMKTLKIVQGCLDEISQYAITAVNENLLPCK